MHVCKGLKKEALKTNLIDQQLQFTSESWLGHAIVIVYILVPNRDGVSALSYFEVTTFVRLENKVNTKVICLRIDLLHVRM